MDFIKGLPISRGNDIILVVVDRHTKYGHLVALSHPFTALKVAQEYLNQVYKLYEALESIVSDYDKIFINQFWQELIQKLKTRLHLSTAYHPETDRQIEVFNRCMTGEKPGDWLLWLALDECWYNSIFHSTIHTTPYEHLPYLVGISPIGNVDRKLQQREAVRKLLKFHLKRVQDRMKYLANHKRSGREFQVGEFVYLKVQPYRQHTIKKFPKFFRPLAINARVGNVAYKLKLPSSSRIHPTFHVSQLKKHVGKAPVQFVLLVVGTDDVMLKEPTRILERRIVKRGNQAVTEVLVEWTNTLPEDLMWEPLQELQRDFLLLIFDDKDLLRRE
ncbi:reverse transcriptase [Gossypium australe]|uniref:Reverse transcriptase n=1 Tax=Gossypium australe TaxID=47621 RepID=A0A5B6VDT5_9ROSI|nr:reverse transcriptase [Gossypium australe]